ncbi:MAG: hypothetical protein M1827_004812 [Pycnora praestabilis]|nr:MAG: hypothetical protein M1827_004812 [Pycnora praestabilis]
MSGPPIIPTAPESKPISTTSSSYSTHSTSSPRRTLTDADRRRMCLYHEENPTVKQTEIGAMFGVERSTVSKVLRQKEKYLFPDDGSRSPIKRSKGKFPDIERALSNWARNYSKQGLPLTDGMIKEKARFFATTVGNSESHLKVNSTSWLEKFKQKNNIGDRRSRKNSEANDSDGALNPDSNAASTAQTPNGLSPISTNGIPSPVPMSSAKSENSMKTESPDDYIDFSNAYRHSHSQSTTSLSSVFTDTAPSSFSAGPTSPTSPFFSPDGPSPFMPSQQSRLPPLSNNYSRPRSQTFPMLGVDPVYISPPPSSEPLTPKYLHHPTASPVPLESPLSEMPPPLSVDETLQSPHYSHSNSNSSPASMQPPPNPRSNSASSLPGSPTQDDARRALEVVMTFFQHQPTGLVDPQEFMTIGKLMEKLRLQGGSLPGGLHRIPEQEDGGIAKLEHILSIGR